MTEITEQTQLHKQTPPAKLARIAAQILQFCRKNQITVQYYESYSTNSIYIKMDCGVLNSIRISDHPGKKHLAYRYEIGPHIHKSSIQYGRWMRYYYQESELSNMFKMILHDRFSKHLQYGDKYPMYMQNNLDTNHRGFWKKAIMITSTETEERLFQIAATNSKRKEPCTC